MSKELIAKWPIEIGIIIHLIILLTFLFSSVEVWIMYLVIIAIIINNFYFYFRSGIPKIYNSTFYYGKKHYALSECEIYDVKEFFTYIFLDIGFENIHSFLLFKPAIDRKELKRILIEFKDNYINSSNKL